MKVNYHAHAVAVGDVDGNGVLDVMLNSGCVEEVHGASYCFGAPTPYAAQAARLFTAQSGSPWAITEFIGHGVDTAGRHTLAMVLADLDLSLIHI